jgi:predicted nucleic acid-binding protein
MTTRFVDSHYLLALLNSRDQDHAAAVKWSRGRSTRLVTTAWILDEVADALSHAASRLRAARFLRSFQEDPFVEVVAPTLEQFNDALGFYERRADKAWSLTDCISFQVMTQRGIVDALTADHHFEQAGFHALLREDFTA